MTAKRFLLGLSAALALGSIGYAWFAPDTLQAAPEVSVRTLDGDDIRLSELHGHPVLVTFWATTCRGCLEELPQLIQLYKEFEPQGLEIIGVAMSYDPPNRVVAMRRSHQIPYPLTLDIRDDISRAFGNVRQTPTSFLIGPGGDIATRHTGEVDMAALRQQIIGMFDRET